MHKMKRWILRLTYIGALSCASSCSIYNGEFDCAPCRGVGCASLSQVNALVNEEFLDDYIGSEDSDYQDRVNHLRHERQIIKQAKERTKKSQVQVARPAPRASLLKKDYILDLPSKGKAAKGGKENKQKEKVTIWFKEEGV